MTDLHFLPATELCRLLRDGDVSSVELLDHFLARVEAHNPGLNAVVALDAERARARAAEADAARRQGESWGPLHGLPITVKDAFETEGLVTTSGAPELRDHVPDSDADAVARLKAAGAVVFGKTNLPIHAGDLQTFNDVYGRTNNPWAPDRSPGGSSGGSAAALAAGLTGLELGSDIGGSIRNPAHYCGVFGLKPTWGVVPPRGHIPGPPGTLKPADVNVVGPLGRSAADLALGLDVLAGPAGLDAAGWRLALPPARNGGALPGLRVATWFDDPFAPIAADTRALLDGAAAALAGGGATVTAVDPVTFSTVAEMDALPAPTGVTSPPATVATRASEPAQITACPASPVPVASRLLHQAELIVSKTAACMIAPARDRVVGPPPCRRQSSRRRAFQ